APSLRSSSLRRPVREDLPAVLVKPAFRLAIGRAATLDEPPERRVVVVLEEMANLVHDHVVEDVVRGEHEPPVEAEGAPARTRAPAASLVAQREPAVGDAERRRLRLRDQRDARLCLASPLGLGETEPLEPETRLDVLRELPLEPCLMEVD